MYVEDSTSGQTIDSILRFRKKIHVLDVRVLNAGYESIVLDEDELVNIIARRAGISTDVFYLNTEAQII